MAKLADESISRALQQRIAELKSELNRHEQMLKLWHKGIGRVTEFDPAHGEVKKPNANFGTKRGPYKKSGDSQRKAWMTRIESPEWKVTVPKVLKSSGKAMNAVELVEAMSPNVHSKTKKILKARCQAYMSTVLIKEGICKKGPEDSQGYVTYLLN